MLSYAYAMKITREAICKRDALRAAEAARVAFAAFASARSEPAADHAVVTLRLGGGASVRVVDTPPSWHRR